MQDIRRRVRRLEVASRLSASGRIAVIPLQYPFTAEQEEAAIESWCAERACPRPPLVVVIKKFCFKRMDGIDA